MRRRFIVFHSWPAETNKGAVVEFFSAKDYLGPDPEGSPEPIASNSARN